MLNEYQFKRNRVYVWLFESIQLVLLTICIYSSFVVMPYAVEQLNSWRPELEQPLALRVVAADTTKQAEKEKQQIAEKVIHAVENKLSPNLSAAALQNIVQDEMKSVEKLQNTPYQLTTKSVLIPPKLINGIIYPQHVHKTVQLEIRGGKGDNFFCAVFPNVCMQEDKVDKEDIAEEAEEDETEETERKQKIKFKWLNKIFGKK